MAASGPVRVLTVLPADPEQMQLGGIATFVRGFVKFAPDDFEFAFLGLSRDRPLWQWTRTEFEGRELAFLPVARANDGQRRRLPNALRFIAALTARRRSLRLGGWVLAFHRPGTDLPFSGSARPMWRVVHLTVADLSQAGSESRWRRLPRLLDRLERRSLRRMSHVYVVNEDAAAVYRERYPEVAEKLSFLPNWADPTIFASRSPAERERLRLGLEAQLDIPAGSPLVLYAGRLDAQKDPLLMARAFGQLLARRPEASLLVAGEGELVGATTRELQEQGALTSVRFLGTVPRPRLAELMNCSVALLVTSHFETGPTVAIEALACGLPVVSTPVGEVARLLQRTGAGAVAERTPEALAAALESVLNMPDSQLRSAAVATAAARLADRVLGGVYELNRELSREASDQAW